MSSLSKEDQEALRLLVQHVARAFYEPRVTIVLDQLVRHPVLKDDDLAGRMGLQLKELNKVMAILENDKLVKIHRQNELKEGAQRSVGRQYFYIDYQHFCNVVKWRMARMRKVIDSKLRNELDNKGYVCPQCGKSFSPLEADKVIDFATGTFKCDICYAELIDNENAESVRGSQDKMQRFNRQMRFITEGLKKTESMVLPPFDVAVWIKTNIIDVERAKAAAQSGDLKIAGAFSNGTQEDPFGIIISGDKDEATQKLERDKEAAAKRAQNVLPAWHTKSTISGELTALGMREEARVAEAAAVAQALEDAEKLPSSNDAILRGLKAPLLPLQEDVKLQTADSQDAEYLLDIDQYYASLAASAAPSTQDTPANPDLGSDFGEEEDVKPSVEYLDSLNDYRKRSRSREDEGVGSTSKLPRMNGDADHNGFPPSMTPLENGVVESQGNIDPSDDPFVYVNGEPVPFSQVTEEHQELMTPEEYMAYYEVATARS